MIRSVTRLTPCDPDERLPISAFIICLNEADYIGHCIESLRTCAEIVIIDSGSTDATPGLVQSYIDAGWPIRFIHQTWLGYAGQKQFALDQCSQPWCLNIDADERLDAALRAELPKLIAAPAEIVGWRVARRPYLIGYGYTPAYVRERKNLRLIRRSQGRYDLKQKVHEGIVPLGKVANSQRGSLLHFRPLPIEQQILKENAYSTLKADQKFAEGKRSSVLKLVVSPILYFIRLYLFNRLFLCGWPGFVQAATGAVYSFLTEVKLLQRAARQTKPPLDDLDGETP